MFVLVTVTIGGSIYAILLKINPDLVRRRSRPRFASLHGESRRQVLNTFRTAEKAIASAGFRKREKTETFGSYTDSAAETLGIEATHLILLARAAWQAAYSPGTVPDDLPLESEVQLHSLKTQLTVWVTPDSRPRSVGSSINRKREEKYPEATRRAFFR